MAHASPRVADEGDRNLFEEVALRRTGERGTSRGGGCGCRTVPELWAARRRAVSSLVELSLLSSEHSRARRSAGREERRQRGRAFESARLAALALPAPVDLLLTLFPLSSTKLAPRVHPSSAAPSSDKFQTKTGVRQKRISLCYGRRELNAREEWPPSERLSTKARTHPHSKREKHSQREQGRTELLHPRISQAVERPSPPSPRRWTAEKRSRLYFGKAKPNLRLLTP